MKGLISALTFLVFFFLLKKKKKRKKGNNKNREMSLLINLKKIMLEKGGG
jgi:hypothetical protein